MVIPKWQTMTNHRGHPVFVSCLWGLLFQCPLLSLAWIPLTHFRCASPGPTGTLSPVPCIFPWLQFSFYFEFFLFIAPVSTFIDVLLCARPYSWCWECHHWTNHILIDGAQQGKNQQQNECSHVSLTNGEVFRDEYLGDFIIVCTWRKHL